MSVSSFARLGSWWFASILILPAACSAASVSRSCPLGTPTAESYTWNFHREAHGLLDDVGAEAQQARVQADQLEGFMLNPNIDWESHALELSEIRDEVNDMGSKLCRLGTIRRVTTPWERKAIDDAAPLITEMATETESAIAYLNGHHDYLFNPSYQRQATDLYQQAAKLTKTVHQFETLDKVHQEDIRLEESLGLIKRS